MKLLNNSRSGGKSSSRPAVLERKALAVFHFQAQTRHFLSFGMQKEWEVQTEKQADFSGSPYVGMITLHDIHRKYRIVASPSVWRTRYVSTMVSTQY